MNEERFYVYGLYESKDAKFPFYIGKGNGDRMNEHFNSREKNKVHHKAHKIKKAKENGKEPEARIIKDGLSEKKAYDIEYLLINIHYEDLTNIRKCWGRGASSGENHPMYGKSHSKETIEKMKGPRPCIQGENSPHYGKPAWNKGKSLKEETKQKMAEIRRGEKSHRAKLSKIEAAEVKWLAKNSNMTQKEIGNKYDIARNTVSYIKNEKSWETIHPVKPKQYKAKNETHNSRS
jgi:DNA-binding XRE family transcriptional regulator